MTSTLSCSICFNAYEDREDGRRPCIGTCGHTLCLSCKSMMPNSTCPFCKADEAFAVTTFNYVLLELIAQQKQNRASVSGTSLCPSCQTPSQRLRLCDNCGVEDGYLEYTSDKHVRIRWLEKDDIVSKENLAKAKSVAKCANCILDDEAHIGHKTIDFGALEEEFNFMIQQRENSRLHIETLDALQSELHQVKDLIKGDSANLENTFSQFGIRDTKPQTQFIENCRHKYRTISAEFDLLRKSFHRLSNMLSDGGAQTPMEVDTKMISGPGPPQPSTASGALPTSTPGRAEFVTATATSTSMPSHTAKVDSPDSKPSHPSAASIASAASMATASPSPSTLFSQQSTATFHSAGSVSTVSSPFTSQAGSSSSLTQMEIDHTIPSTSSSTPPILFDYKRPPMTFESKIVIADRKQNKPTDPLLVGVFDIATESYKTIGKLQTMRANYALARKDSLLFIVGGMHGGNWLALVEVYDREKNYRREVARLITARTRCSALVYNNKLYVAGGYSGIYMKSVEVWDFTGGWKETKPLNYARADAVLIEYGGKMFAMGGYNGKEYEERIEVYDEAKNIWTEYGYMRGSRAGFAATVFGKRIYIAGGWSSSNNTLKTMKSWSPESKEWREEPSMNLPRKYLTLATITEGERDLHILALRGNAENWDLVQVNEKFEPQAPSPKWHPLNQRA